MSWAHVWYVAVDEIVCESLLVSFGGTFSHLYETCHESKSIEDTSASTYIEPTAMAGRNTSPTLAAGVAGIIKQVWCVAVDILASDRSLRSLGGTFSRFY